MERGRGQNSPLKPHTPCCPRWPRHRVPHAARPSSGPTPGGSRRRAGLGAAKCVRPPSPLRGSQELGGARPLPHPLQGPTLSRDRQHEAVTPQGNPKRGRQRAGVPEGPGLSCGQPQSGGCGVLGLGLYGPQVAQERGALGPRAPRPHLEPDAALLTAQAGQHEGDEREEAGEGHRHHGQGGRPGGLAERGAVCRGRAQSRAGGPAASAATPTCAQPPSGAAGRPRPGPGSPVPDPWASLGSAALAPRPHTCRDAARPRAGGRTGRPRRPSLQSRVQPLGAALSSPGGHGVDIAAEPAHLLIVGVHRHPSARSGSQKCGGPPQVSLRFWSPRLAPLDPATGTVIIAEATGMALGKAEIPGGPRGPGAGRGGLRSALLGGKVSWPVLSVSPTQASRQLGDRAVRHKACPASEDRDPAVPGRCCVGRAVVSSSMWPGVPESPPCRTCHQGDPLLQHLVHVSPLVANAHQMGSPRCPGQQDTAPSTYSRPSD